MIYLALLRGINVGGKNKVEMSRLKVVFESLGCKNVSTYINSGNVVFSDGRDPKELKLLIETAVLEEFSLSIPVVLRNSSHIKKLCAEIPDSWTNDTEQKTDVLFLWDEIADQGILEKIIIDPEIENVKYLDGDLVWNISRKFIEPGEGIKLIKSTLFKQMTVRNINTVRKMAKLLNNASEISRG